jgi:hypothetical protein
MKKLIFVLPFVFAIALVACKKKPEPVQEAPPPPPKVEKPLSIEQQMQKAVETAKAQGKESYSEGNKIVKKWETFNSWEFVKPFQEKYLFDISYELPDSRTLLPVGVPNHPEDPQSIFLFHCFKDDPGKLFVPNNAIVYWGAYKSEKGTEYFAWGPEMKELPLRKK